MPKPKEGVLAPSINAIDQNGDKITLSQFKGDSAVVLYFYPKDNTPGCTVEACEFQAAKRKFTNAKAIVIGVSPDAPKSHIKFIEKFGLKFSLISDEDKSVCKAYGTWIKKSMYGREYMGVARSTFIINKQGKITKIFEKVKAKGHAEEVLLALKNEK
ncbi:MAG: peroxiredoxin Q/BCP [Candidatus Omnitrophota bacterium]|jgi:peroxiredoxin Q/BCP